MAPPAEVLWEAELIWYYSTLGPCLGTIIFSYMLPLALIFHYYSIMFYCYADGTQLMLLSLLMLQLQPMFCRSVWQGFRAEHLNFKVNLRKIEVKLILLWYMLAMAPSAII